MTLNTAKGDLMDGMWSEYLKDVKDYDERTTDEWKEDAEGVLVFVSPNFFWSQYPPQR